MYGAGLVPSIVVPIGKLHRLLGMHPPTCSLMQLTAGQEQAQQHWQAEAEQKREMQLQLQELQQKVCPAQRKHTRVPSPHTPRTAL